MRKWFFNVVRYILMPGTNLFSHRRVKLGPGMYWMQDLEMGGFPIWLINQVQK